MQRLPLSPGLIYGLALSSQGDVPMIIGESGDVLANNPQDILRLIPKEHLGAFRLGMYCSSLLASSEPTNQGEAA